MKKIFLLFIVLLVLLTGCSKEDNLDNEDSLCKYKPSMGGCEEIFYEGGRCNIINEGQCQLNEFQVFKTLEECENLCVGK